MYKVHTPGYEGTDIIKILKDVTITSFLTLKGAEKFSNNFNEYIITKNNEVIEECIEEKDIIFKESMEVETYETSINEKDENIILQTTYFKTKDEYLALRTLVPFLKYYLRTILKSDYEIFVGVTELGYRLITKTKWDKENISVAKDLFKFIEINFDREYSYQEEPISFYEIKNSYLKVDKSYKFTLAKNLFYRAIEDKPLMIV